MADETDELLLDDPIEEQHEEAADDSFEVELEGEEPHQDTENMRRMRDHLAALTKDNAELRRKVAPVPVEVGAKPDLWTDCEGDPDKFEAALLAWTNRKRDAEQQQSAQAAQTETANRTFIAAKMAHDERAKRVKGVDMAAAERIVADRLGSAWVGAIVESSPVSERVLAALAKYPQQLDIIANEPIEWKKMRMLWDLEGKVKTNMAKTPPPAPESETLQRGSAPVARVSDDKKLANLEKEARRTGNRTPLIDYKRALAAKGKGK